MERPIETFGLDLWITSVLCGLSLVAMVDCWRGFGHACCFSFVQSGRDFPSYSLRHVAYSPFDLLRTVMWGVANGIEC